ncbi:MAG: hypothetical protein SRB2_01220 [Desulfobacteraceae bacterium Eth-SRB2]|nr:MAG: hypothetical protein SRB2_01220 [Desulfobacteraceae bacterium Eth-SRB2]
MKILEFRLIAYGPFTDRGIDLSGGNQGLHVIYGPNEAGKSSALRALRNLLYGIPERSTDDFFHPYAKMRIGAAIQSGTGDVLEVVRRKGRRNTLRSGDDKTVIEESLLNKFLSGVDADLFVTLFGIDHADLVRGGKEIIRGGGSMGRLIFAAGSGASNLRGVQEQLKSEADGLFTPAGRKKKINEAIGKININRKDLRNAQLPGRQWATHDQALNHALARKQTVEKDLAKKRRALHRFERIQEALPVMAKRKERINEFRTYATAVLLPEEFPTQRRDLLTTLKVAENDRDRALKSMEVIQKELSDLQISKSLLENSTLIEEIHREFGSQHKAAGDGIKLETRMSVLLGEAGEILRSLRDDLTLDHAEKLRIKKSEAVRIQDLGTRFERIVTRIHTARETIPNLTHRIEKNDRKLEKLGTPRQVDLLKDAISRAEEYGALEKHHGKEQSEIRSALKTLDAALGKQTLWSGSVEKLERLPVPSMETIGLFEDQTAEVKIKYESLKEDFEKTQRTLADVERQIDELRLQQEVPTEKDLQKAREQRGRGWQLILHALEGKPVLDQEIGDYIKEVGLSKTLSEAFENSVHKADEIADRLRREAERVATKAKLLADQTAHKKRRGHLKAEINAAEKVKEKLANEWMTLWEPSEITPRSPKEMRAWAQHHMALATKAKEIREHQARVDRLKEEIDVHLKSLNQCLKNLFEPLSAEGETLTDLIKRSKRVIRSEEDLHNKIKQLGSEKAQREQELAEAQARVDSSEMDLSQWQQEWAQAVRPLGLDADAVPAQANAVMEDLNSLFGKLKDANILQKRIHGINRDADEFAIKVTGLVDAVAKDLKDLPAGDATLELNNRLTRARTAQSQRQTLKKQLSQEQNRMEKAVGRIAEIETRLNGMCEEAGCERYEDLPEAERKSEKRRQIEAELYNLDERLHQLSAGDTVDDFINQASKVDPDGIDGEIHRLTEETDTLNQEKSELDQCIGSERTELGKMDGSARAAGLAEEIQLLLGRLENDVEHYARLKIASKILNQAIERYREKSQGPILKHTTDFFKQITRGSFQGIRAEFDDTGQPVLVGVRAGGKEIVPVDGMSDGTADQLYLALRLAGLRDYLERNEPIPFIVDDILIKFDDDRAVAALQALGRLSEQTQVIFFTHHRHLLELARKNVESSFLIEHMLNA